MVLAAVLGLMLLRCAFRSIQDLSCFFCPFRACELTVSVDCWKLQAVAEGLTTLNIGAFSIIGGMQRSVRVAMGRRARTAMFSVWQDEVQKESRRGAKRRDEDSSIYIYMIYIYIYTAVKDDNKSILYIYIY